MKNSTIKGFENAQLMKFYNSKTFQAPSIEEIIDIKEGDWVKVCHNDERFWCKFITWSKDTNSMFIEVDNKLVFSDHPFQLGDTIEVYPHHIYDIVSSDYNWSEDEVNEELAYYGKGN